MDFNMYNTAETQIFVCPTITNMAVPWSARTSSVFLNLKIFYYTFWSSFTSYYHIWNLANYFFVSIFPSYCQIWNQAQNWTLSSFTAIENFLRVLAVLVCNRGGRLVPRKFLYKENTVVILHIILQIMTNFVKPITYLASQNEHCFHSSLCISNILHVIFTFKLLISITHFHVLHKF